MNTFVGKVCIIYPADPMGVIPGGIDTFIRGILRWAPDDLEISLVGVTTDPMKRPVGHWNVCDLGRREFKFFPVAALDNPARRGRIPLSVLFSLGLLSKRPKIDADVLEFHRIEPMLAFLFDSRPKTAFIHQNMQDLRNPSSDILWSRVPGLYFRMEEFLLKRLRSIYSVRKDAVDAYQARYPKLKDRFQFVPTWMDPDIFFPADQAGNSSQKTRVCIRLGLPEESEILVTVGRLDSQKDPLLLANAFRLVSEQRPNARLVYIGDGVLRDKLAAHLDECGLNDRALLLGLQPPDVIADILRSADLFVLSSAYEGMPMCVLEALGSGLPVVTTDVGEVRRVVVPNKNGEIVETRTPQAFADAVNRVLSERSRYAGVPCTNAVLDYTPEHVLKPIYENYRILAESSCA